MLQNGTGVGKPNALCVFSPRESVYSESALEVDLVANQYNCLNCPGYCCSYPLIALTKRDVERLAKHFDMGFREAKKKFTKPQEKEEFTMRRKKDEHFGYICQFFDTEKRCCSIYQSRPSVCRSFPGTGRCGYYDFLMFERRAQEDDEFVATTWSGSTG